MQNRWRLPMIIFHALPFLHCLFGCKSRYLVPIELGASIRLSNQMALLGRCACRTLVKCPAILQPRADVVSCLSTSVTKMRVSTRIYFSGLMISASSFRSVYWSKASPNIWMRAGSSSQYQRAVLELQSFENTLTDVDALFQSYEHLYQPNDLRQKAIDCVQLSRECVEGFDLHVKRYRRRLGRGELGNLIADQVAKIR